MTDDPSSVNALALDLWDEGRTEEAEQCFRRASEVAPDWSVPLYNLGLLCKAQCRWHESLEFNRRAVEVDSSNAAAWWNLGIAATAVSDWPVARRAWRGFGLEMPDEDNEVRLDLGLVPVRLDPEGRGEVVWSHRIDPARAIIRNIPLPESGFCEGDLVLHDGVPAGARMHDGEEVPVFDVIGLLTLSPRSTFETWVRAPRPEDLTALHEISRDLGVAVEDWTGEVRNVCAECSLGLVHDPHDRATAPWKGKRHVGLSALALHHADEVLGAWVEGEVGRRIQKPRAVERRLSNHVWIAS